MGRKIVVSVNETVSAQVSATWAVTHGHTGRKLVDGHGYALAADWAKSDVGSLMLHPARAEFEALISNAPAVSDSLLVCYRGRGIVTGHPRSADMGPPPQSHRGEGRYHRAGQRALYLADSELGVQCELQAWHVEGIPYVQVYRLPTKELRIANCSDVLADHFIAAVFSFAEGCNVQGRGPANYVFSQTVAAIVSGAGFDGMRVPGVRGSPGRWYNNIVVFEPDERWVDWLDQSAEPYELAL